ncbi:MAG: hypothetical protein HZB56_03520 [Deltaproteobacteria bacterium]|nr:hypothetical protein [Deltaproteobacteria bacterium]
MNARPSLLVRAAVAVGHWARRLWHRYRRRRMVGRITRLVWRSDQGR